MTIPTKVEINCATGAITERPLNDEELAQLEIDKANAVTSKAKADADVKKLADLKASAKTKLIAGEALTDEEASSIVI